jgi:tetratricopeptide (TPR) repeat protein
MTKAKKSSASQLTQSLQVGNGSVGVGGNVDHSTILTGEHATVIQQAAPLPESHDTIGFIPSAKVVTYVHRGQIEEDVRAFLKNGGTGAIVGLHAPGGLGKTELAKHATEELKSQFEGVLWVDVGERNPQQVVADMLIQCNVQTRPGALYEEQRNELKAHLFNRRFLVVLDDVCKNALEGLNDILPPKPCATLLTSRIHQIGGVNKTFELDAMTPAQARELMEAVLGEETVKAEAATAAKLAERCAFNPLAVEIAARRIRQFEGRKKPIAHYFEMAQARFSELVMDGDARWDMTRIFDLSYKDLSEEDQKCFRSLAAFDRSGFSFDALLVVWEMEPSQARAILSRFINLSLVKIVPTEEETLDRYRLHDLLDEYAAGRLSKEEETQVRNAVAQWIIALFTQCSTDDRTTAPQAAAERANLMRSCEWARGQKNGKLLAQLITQSRNWFYNIFREEWVYWRAWLEASLKLGVDDPQLKANVRKAIGDVQQFRKEMDAALESYNEALKLFRQVGAKLGEANVISSQGQMYLPDDLDKANEYLNKALQVYQKIGSLYSIPAQIGNYGWKLYRLGEYEKAKPYLLQAADLFEKIGLMDYAERHRNAANRQ